MPVTKKQKVQDAKDDVIIVAIPGARGSFTGNAAEEKFGGIRAGTVELKGAQSFKGVFQMVADGTAQYGVVPVESSMSGSMQKSHDLLIQFPLFIVGEIAATEKHYMVANKGMTLDKVKKVYSHPHLLMQCDKFLEDMPSNNLERICVDNSIVGCEIVKNSTSNDIAAIASTKAAEIHGLEIIGKEISNYSPMMSRYIVIAKEQFLITNPMITKKQSICVSLSNAPGTIHRIVSCFGFRNIDVLRMEARPSSTALEMFTGTKCLKHWDYVYHIDFVPAPDDKTNQCLMDNLSEYCIAVRNFGTYPASVAQTEIAVSAFSAASATLFI